MQHQTEMETSMLRAHRDFVSNLEKSLDILDRDLSETSDATPPSTTVDWCTAAESIIDELHRCIYSISEPRWASPEDAKNIRRLRCRVKDIYAKYSRIRE
jgi:hypothetical protein